MAEATVLRSSSINRSVSAAAQGGDPQAQVSGQHPVVHVNMNANGPKISGGSQAGKGVTILPPKGSAPKAVAPKLALSPEQLMFCRFLADKYLGEQVPVAAGEEPSDNAKLAASTIDAIDAQMAAAAAAAVVVAQSPAQVQQPARAAVGPRVGQATSAAPRRVARTPGGAPPAPVAVRMDGQNPVIENPIDVTAQE